MRPNEPRPCAGFTLLELVIVLAILAIITGLATREIGHLQDQQRYDASQRGLKALEDAILGTPDDRSPDGYPAWFSFVSDMGRLPRVGAIAGEPGLPELWQIPDPAYAFGIRPAVEDPQVYVPGGWRGPYIRRPLGADNIRDGWGNPFVLCDEHTNQLAVGQTVRLIRHLGANGVADAWAVSNGYTRDYQIALPDPGAELIAAVEVNGWAYTNAAADKITVRVFGPDPADPAVVHTVAATADYSANHLNLSLSGLTMGARIVRAYLTDYTAASGALPPCTNSAVREIWLRPGPNHVELAIDR